MLRISSKLNILGLLVCLAGFTGLNVIAQNPVPKTPKPAPPPPRAERAVRPQPREFPEGRGINERALAVDPNVNIKLPCISQARVTVTGWDRNEIRVFVKNGTTVNFKVHEKDPKSGKPVWVLITRQAPGLAAGPFADCLSGDRIDIEVPVGASLTISGRETETRIDTVKKVNLKNLGGNVALRNVTGGIVAETFEGDVAVENSAGQISLKTSTGNIIAFEVNPGQVGDVFKAMTSSGSVTLQKVEHRQIEANSVSGTLLFSGKFLPGGIYNFKTANGSMKLSIPQASSFKLAAWYGYGSIDSELPMKIITENVSSGGKSLTALFGDGDSTVYLTTNSGRISITKQ